MPKSIDFCRTIKKPSSKLPMTEFFYQSTEISPNMVALATGDSVICSKIYSGEVDKAAPIKLIGKSADWSGAILASVLIDLVQFWHVC